MTSRFTRKELRHRSSSMNDAKRIIPSSKNEKYRLARQCYREKHHDEHLEACKRWHEKRNPSIIHRDRSILFNIPLDERLKIYHKCHIAKRRCLGFIVIYPNIIDETIAWHHLSNQCVLAIPKDLHELYPGVNLDFHRFMCNEIAKQIYIAPFN